MTGKRALFIHVPKTGGTSLYKMLAAHFGPDAVHNPRVRANAPSPWGAGHPIVLGHFHYTPTLREHFDWIGTILRHPVPRIWSLYRHARRESALGLHEAAKTLPFRSFIRYDAPQLVNWQTRQLASWGTKHVNAVALAQAAAALATFNYVGTARDARDLKGAIATAFESIAYALGGDEPRVPTAHERKAVEMGDEAFTAEDVRVIEARNPFDVALCGGPYRG